MVWLGRGLCPPAPGFEHEFDPGRDEPWDEPVSYSHLSCQPASGCASANAHFFPNPPS